MTRLLASTLLMMVPLASAVASSPSLKLEVIGLNQRLDWRGQPGDLTAHGLAVTEFVCDQETRRILLITPGHGRVILDTIVRPADGLSRYRLRDEVAGWWVELREESPIRIPPRDRYTYGGNLFWQRAMAAGGDEPADSPVLYAVETSAGEVVEFATTAWNDEATGELFRVANERGTMRALVGKMPPGSAEAVMFLKSLLEAQADGGVGIFHARLLIHFLAAAVAEHGEPSWRNLYDALSWEATPSADRGTRLEREWALDVAARFRSLADRHHPLRELQSPQRNCDE
jgi:hypothetical protein